MVARSSSGHSISGHTLKGFGHVRTPLLAPVGLAAFALVASAGPALAQPITFTESESLAESFADEPFLCQDELYFTSVEGHTLTHLTAAGITDLNHVVAKGSDGSMAYLAEHHHFTVTANGDVSVQLDQLITRC